MSTNPPNIPSSSDDAADPKPTLEQLFGTYPIQITLMRNLNVYDFRNLRSAGCQLPVSPEIQSKYLMRIQCNEFRSIIDSTSACGKTPDDVEEMRLCQGLCWRPDDDFRITRHPNQASHLHDGYDQSTDFWVCTECRHQNLEHYRLRSYFQIPYTPLCKIHSHEHGGLPYNACRCRTNAIGDWKCYTCVIGSFLLLENRATKSHRMASLLIIWFGIWTSTIRPDLNFSNWLVWILLDFQDVVNMCIPREVRSRIGIKRKHLQFIRLREFCPIENYRRARWKSPRAMQMCLECKVVFPVHGSGVWLWYLLSSITQKTAVAK